MPANSLHLVTAPEAADAMGVTAEQVRRYVRSGLLPATKKAGVWLLPGSHVDALAGRRPNGGRPLSCAAAWRHILAGSVDMADPYRYRNRGLVTRLSGSPVQVQQVLQHPDIMIGGIHAGMLHGAMLGPLPDEAQFYLPLSAASRVPEHMRPWSWLAPDPIGEVVARVVPDDLWPRLVTASVPAHGDPPVEGAPAARYAPAALAMLDLAVSPHARERSASHDLRPPASA